MSVELTNTPILTPSQIGELATQLDAIHTKALKAIERLNKDIATRKSEIANRWKSSGISDADQQRYAESETVAAIGQIKDTATKELDAILKQAGAPNEQIVAQRQFYDSPVKVLARAGLGSPERTHYAQQLQHAGPSELGHMAQLAVSSKNEALAAAVLSLLDATPTQQRPLSPQHLARAMELEAYSKVQTYQKLAEARLHGIIVAIRTFRAGRANPLNTLSLALREREIEALGDGAA